MENENPNSKEELEVLPTPDEDDVLDFSHNRSEDDDEGFDEDIEDVYDDTDEL